ncbi:MAG: C45 family peptidase [Candidatus Lokiarchaeota archaeon]|nr:C45 family peptidase [Candidatus Harpocratesius repetitus]
MKFNFYLPYFEFFGSGYDLGLKIGQKFRKRIKNAYKYSPFIKKLQEIDKQNPEYTDQMILIGKRKYPKYIMEIEGMAEGAKVDVRNLFLMNFRHSYEFGCSSILIKEDQNSYTERFYLGHNEDHDYYLASNAYLVKVILENGISFLSHLYPGCLAGPSFWVNSYGVGISGNAINEPKKKLGIPKSLLDRAAVETKSISEILSILTNKSRSGGYSYNIFSMPDFSLINLETTSTDYASISVVNNSEHVKSPIFFHTNHYINPRFSHIKNKLGNSSDRRLQALRNKTTILSKCLNNKSTFKILPSTIKQLLFHDSVHVSPKNINRKLFTSKIHGITSCTVFFTIERQKIDIEIIPHNQNEKKIKQFTLKDGIISKIQ